MKIDMDKTISGMLTKYYDYVNILIAKEKERINAISDNIDFEIENMNMLSVERANKFFKMIVDNPKKYLYRLESITFIGVDGDNQPCDWFPGVTTISDKTQPIRNLTDKYNMMDVLYYLSTVISKHVKHHGLKNTWIYETGSRKFSDLNQYDCILDLNKYINLLSVKGFAYTVKDKLPARYFAEKYKEQR